MGLRLEINISDVKCDPHGQKLPLKLNKNETYI